MSQGQGGRGGPPQRPGWSPLNFRSPSPFVAPSPPPRLGSPSAHMFNNRVPYGMACPRPRWPGPAPLSPTLQGPKPFKRPLHPPSPAPNRCASPLSDHYYQGIQPYTSRTYSPVPYSPISCAQEVGPPSRDYELVGMPMTPPPPPQNYSLDEDEDSGPSTAEIIANQSQDYIDEKLAEYQATIYMLQGYHCGLNQMRNQKYEILQLALQGKMDSKRATEDAEYLD